MESNTAKKAVFKWTCDNCGNKLSNPLKCSRCMSAPYCNKECQTNHWNEHKKLCGIDIVMPPEEEMSDIAFRFIEYLKRGEGLLDDILDQYKNISYNKIVCASVIWNRPIKKFQKLTISQITMNDFDITTKSKMQYDLYDKNKHVYIIIKSERTHLMIHAAIPLTEFNTI